MRLSASPLSVHGYWRRVNNASTIARPGLIHLGQGREDPRVPTRLDPPAQDHEGRTRVLALIDDMDYIEEFLTALTTETPDTVWHALIQVRDEIPARLQTRLAERARELGRDDDADALAPLGTTAN
ncbi:hypothetical protein [Nocardia sp. NPDC059228]|uniref:hypothetical protein n=1 Tax=Nocardia sp. NPDC059228 TaxID=3346777 RepID=UPI0036CD5887